MKTLNNIAAIAIGILIGTVIYLLIIKPVYVALVFEYYGVELSTTDGSKRVYDIVKAPDPIAAANYTIKPNPSYKVTNVTLITP